MKTKEMSKDNEQRADYTKEHVDKLEADLLEVCDGILALIDKNLIPSESAGEPKVFYYKMKSNLYRYLAECATSDARSTAAEDTRAAYTEATRVPSDRMQKTVEVPQVQYIDRTVDVPVVMQGQVLASQTVRKTAGSATGSIP